MANFKQDILLVSTADWDNPYWTNKQHVAVELARLGYRIIYVESQGLRRPSASSKDMSRIWRRIKSGLRHPRNVRQNIWVCSPILIPFQGSEIIRHINRILLKLSLIFWQRHIGIAPSIVWTYSPITSDLYDLSSYKKVIYHCVDDIKSQPGMPINSIKKLELELVKKSNFVFTTSEKLQTEHEKNNNNTYYFSNVADYEHFSKSRKVEERPADIEKIEGPIIGFVGALSGYKVDFDLIEQIARRHTEWQIVLIGEVGEGDPWTKIDSLRHIQNVHIMGGRAYGLLPQYLRWFDVAILPCRINEYTRAMFPMKFFEYLAAGLNVVSTALPALQPYKSVAYLANDPEEFINCLEAVLLNKEAIAGICRDNAARLHTYEIRTKKMLDVLELTY